MNILLINPPCGPRTIGLKNMARIEPLGLELVGAGIPREHQVVLVDMAVRPSDLAATLRHFTPDIVGVTSEIVHVEPALQALRQTRAAAPECMTVVGGHHPTVYPQDFFADVVDLIVLGEGVDTFRDICAAKAEGTKRYDHIPGIIARTDQGFRATPARPLPVTLDQQPMPDRSLTARYRDRYYYLFEDSVAAVRTSAGCSFPCIFCSCRVYSQGKFIPRSPKLVFEEIASLPEEFIMFCDDHSFHDPQRMRTLAELLLEAGIHKRYFAYARADSIIADREVFALWAKAGLYLVMTGLESLDQHTLRRIGKKVNRQQNEEAIAVLRELGINMSAGFLVEPHFRDRDFKAIDDYLAAHPSILLAEYTPTTPFPGTPLYEKARPDLLTEDRQVYDLQHFLTPTTIPSQELYRLMLRSYRKVIFRVIRKLKLWHPHRLFSRRVLRILTGICRNQLLFQRAHKDVPATVLSAAERAR